MSGASFLTITTTYTYRGSAFVVPSATAKAGIENMVRSVWHLRFVRILVDSLLISIGR